MRVPRINSEPPKRHAAAAFSIAASNFAASRLVRDSNVTTNRQLFGGKHVTYAESVKRARTSPVYPTLYRLSAPSQTSNQGVWAI